MALSLLDGLQLALKWLRLKSQTSALYNNRDTQPAGFGNEVKDGGNENDRKGGCSDAASFHLCLNPEVLRSTLAHMPSFSSISTL